MKLSPAEKQIIEYLANGLTDAEIAEKRGRSISTVRRQIEDARRKLDALTVLI
jgi:DNA-binding CsgD family transcriptional regulator